MRRASPSFEPARPVIAACVRAPVDTDPVPLITDPVTARVMDAFNVSYEVLLYTLGRFFGHGHETPPQLKALADVAVGLMVRVLRPLGETVTTLPAGPGHDGKTAGPSPVVAALRDLAALLAAQKDELAAREVGFPPAWGVGAVDPHA